ncbi:30S ribosomal protein S16 [Candidatus Portiera aleyrodidarum]|uniref:Small ribosomal subunit protein bS16 n=1 Tax=Candidatus Portiera aleyrodidarum MED (Bemisia tabaci) TaxID=1163752 RepID=A0AAU8RPB1_9GAMM|nr:30S ribosomal protein S16 [Candidatus Portiera aleyrodidarum]AFQ24224.1 SSU ribosomal protein S16P [Candidatus Portiera aleyrodidarum BT-B-HRs]AFS18979.1 30S ribosomal protein S1 [Candidatus Portiera aleyrodidarum BT-QVLC]AFT80639.1 SSU ribosomal protein S16p [Candidatus Portiera aleyrodidarum BT-QVLC]AFT80912.1 SSU ribosomal protein S16p [Candidatus Portiera aleyrodidarum BT-B-HRs]AJF24202.1 30S ribosomal protein S16 [Candidatus Portiera aleyrodidarum MED (Bemisia tabaci)]
MVKIRMTRCGCKNRPFYQINVKDSRSSRDGKFIEKIGYYNPLVISEKRFCINSSRLGYWKNKGAKISNRVLSLLKKNKKDKK